MEQVTHVLTMAAQIGLAAILQLLAVAAAFGWGADKEKHSPTPALVLSVAALVAAAMI